MSTSRSRLTRSIQEIAKRDPDLRRAIEATKPRGDQPSAAGVGTSDAERDRVCCDGSVSDETNPGTETRDPSEGGQDGLNSDNPADISDMGPGSLSGVTDCATGEPVCFEGSDWVPPDGWDEPNEPPTKEGYAEGEYWAVSTNTEESRAPDPDSSCSQHWDTITNSPDLEYYEARRVSSSRYDCYSINTSNDFISFFEYVVTFGCNGSSENYCTEVPYEDAWPSDSCVNLAIKGGSIVGSKYDPENDGTYSKPMSEIELCDDFGNSFFLRPSSSGGWKTISATKDAGYLWSSTGQKIAHIDGNEYSDPSI